MRSRAAATTCSCSRSAGRCPRRERVSRMDNRPEAIRADLEASLRRLGARPRRPASTSTTSTPSTPIEESWGELQRLIEEGKVRWAGLSNHTAELVERAHAGRAGHLVPGAAQPARRAGRSRRCSTSSAPTGSASSAGHRSRAASSPTASRLDALDPDDFRRRSRLAERLDEIERHREEAAGAGPNAAAARDRLGARAARRDRRDRRRSQRPHEGAELTALAADRIPRRCRTS